MSNTVISIENLSKTYRLGQIGTGTLSNDLKRWWARQRGKPDPYQKIGEEDYGNRLGETLWALKDINLRVQQGEILGIIGRNGAGKSTLLKILSEVTAPTSGEVKIKGRIASLLEVGTGFHPDLTGRENIYLNGAILGMNTTEISRKFDEIVDFAGIEQFIDTPVKRYSSGMYVRLAFAVAAHLEPEILVIDEVLAVGDAEFQKKCLGKMGAVAHEGRTVLFVSHNMPSIQKLCKIAILIDKGEIKNSGPTEEVTSEYLAARSDKLFIWKKFDGKKKGMAYFTQIFVADDHLEPTNLVTSSGSLRIVADFVLEERSKELILSIDLLDSDQNVIFESSPIDSKINNPEKAGSYRFLFETPPGILMPQVYWLKAMLWKRTEGLVDAVESINICVSDVPSLANQYFIGRHGHLALKCDWQLLNYCS